MQFIFTKAICAYARRNSISQAVFDHEYDHPGEMSAANSYRNYLEHFISCFNFLLSSEKHLPSVCG